MVGRKKKEFFHELQHCVMKKLSGWTTQNFSRGGKEVLIKAVAQAIPAYAMVVFRLPVGFVMSYRENLRLIGGVRQANGERFIGWDGIV